VDRTEIIANVTKIVFGIHDAFRAGRQVKAQAVDLENFKNDLIRVSTSGAPGASGGVGVLTEVEHRPTSADHEETIQPSSIATRSELDPETMRWQLGQARGDLWELEAHLKHQCRGCGRAVDCCWKHGRNLVDIATETKSMTTDLLWNEILELGNEIKVKCHPDNIRTGKYFNEMPSLVLRVSDLRRRVDTKLIELEPPPLTLDEAKAEAAKLAEEEVEELWRSREKR